MGFRESDQGLASMQKLCRTLNMPPPMSKPACNKVVRLIQPCYTDVAVSSMEKAAEDATSLLNQSNEEGPVNCIVSVDGSWQSCGHASLNGIVTAIAKKLKNVLHLPFLCYICSFTWEQQSKFCPFEARNCSR